MTTSARSAASIRIDLTLDRRWQQAAVDADLNERLRRLTARARTVGRSTR